MPTRTLRTRPAATLEPDGRPDVDLDLAKYLLFGLDSIEGWGIDRYLARLFLSLDDFHKQGRLYGNLLEIGVHHGRTSVLLCLMAAAGEIGVFVDLFERQGENVDFSGRGDRQIFEANLARWAPDRTARVVQANSIDLDFASVGELKEGVRFAHIDGAHYPEAVLNDIAKTRSVLLDGGVVVVDDFMHTGFPGVNEACNAYLASSAPDKLAPVAIGCNKLLLTTADAHAALLAHLMAFEPARPKTVFHEQEVLCLDPH
jgi:hypothetical protein